MRVVSVVFLLLPSSVAFLPQSRPRGLAPVTLSQRRRHVHMATTASPPETSKVIPDETFPGVTECPMTAWGPRDVNIKEAIAEPMYDEL